ncbi:MAG TPA: cbb3-type cytochrome c oxidase N-terminal domain-containing protein, partial [Candidatus Acidoferrales bacterium]|nr:cbb3-type cytochrome c oxidase N-terminal domain-containing protein [Candidatus Acidoferrales bacterium]
DNNLPRWWVWLFYITIIFSVVYMVYYHVAKAGDLSEAEYKKEMKAGAALKANAMGRFEANMSTLTPSSDAAVLDAGHQIYAKLCAPCHRLDGGGLVGPNLTDNYWIHGSNYVDTVKVIWDGVPAKGMITWKTMLKPEEVQSVASYIYTLRGAKLSSPGKPPENQQVAQPAANQFE